MASFKINKVNELPTPLEANSFYAVKVGQNFHLYLTDAAGSTARALDIEATFESISKNLRSTDAVLNHVGGVLTSITYADGVVKTFTYGPNGLATVVLSGAIPDGPDLTKTLTYTSGILTGVAYS